VAAVPSQHDSVTPSSLTVETATVVTTDRRVEKSEQRSYSTARTEGTSTSVADTVTWNDWQEVSTTTPLAASSQSGATVRDLANSGSKKGSTEITGVDLKG